MFKLSLLFFFIGILPSFALDPSWQRNSKIEIPSYPISSLSSEPIQIEVEPIPLTEEQSLPLLNAQLHHVCRAIQGKEKSFLTTQGEYIDTIQAILNQHEGIEKKDAITYYLESKESSDCLFFSDELKEYPYTGY